MATPIPTNSTANSSTNGTTQTTGNQNLTFAQRTEKRMTEENQWEQYNSRADFYVGNIQKSLEILAQKTFPTDSMNRKAYQEAIVKSMTETLSPEIGIKDFWEKMGDAGCTTLEIIDGHLNFFNAQNERMDITPYTQPIVFEAHSSYYEERIIERKERIKEAHQQLEDLIREINKNRRN